MIKTKIFNAVLTRLVAWMRSSLISEDTMEIASYLYVKIVYNIVNDALRSPCSEGEGRGSILRIG
jgi:hypothetical protein